ncbi:hypothetical protein BpHYR1_008482 [Brachionus plicatilis]|uniref:Uncharacterized protein n=1 Tax=Brachionus plicatilis TaxID=10195 RepID=A0A3M7S8Q4_BRAPC|nr:hypothetical protein BpHYR1_008482 [Brachionus plicatilis]
MQTLNKTDIFLLKLTFRFTKNQLFEAVLTKTDRNDLNSVLNTYCILYLVPDYVSKRMEVYAEREVTEKFGNRKMMGSLYGRLKEKHKYLAHINNRHPNSVGCSMCGLKMKRALNCTFPRKFSKNYKVWRILSRLG